MHFLGDEYANIEVIPQAIFLAYFAAVACLVMAIPCVNNLGLIFIAGIQDHTCVTPANHSTPDNLTTIDYYAGKVLHNTFRKHLVVSV